MPTLESISTPAIPWSKRSSRSCAPHGGSARMPRMFNCGIGMFVIVDSSKAAQVLRAFRSGTENTVTLGPFVAIEAGEMVGYSGRLAL
jgi:phosphoribosylaminoimidazole (AIR) synthetase